MELDVTNSVVLGWEPAAQLTTSSDIVEEDEVHDLPSSVESTLASLPYDDFYFPSCIDASLDDDHRRAGS